MSGTLGWTPTPLFQITAVVFWNASEAKRTRDHCEAPMAEAKSVELEAQTLSLEGEPSSYDYLVLAAGAVPSHKQDSVKNCAAT